MDSPFGPSRASDLGAEAREIMVGLLMSHGQRELLAAHVFGSALRLAPTLDEKMLLAEQALEELEHFEAVSALYAELTHGSDLHAAVADVAQLPPPTSWSELAVAQFLLCRAETFQLAEYRGSSCRRYAEIIDKLEAQEQEHAHAGEATLEKVCRESPLDRASLDGHVARWLRISLGLFMPIDRRREARAVTLGLRGRGSTEAMQAFVDRIRADLSRYGLSIRGES
ncbi:ferritin-like domain-containing protein [Pendulispora brunnea]|uniref:Ferritin-like domain-containing protein n=1 Tax=Pendulispora brunnea TaxID=2905690 RepID=A0ABZ2JZ30_9BACT